MHTWLKVTIILCIFGFLKELRPSEPFVYEFLIGPWRNLTEQQINEQVYPVGTYSYLAQLIIVFLITDVCRYKPLIVVLGLCGILVWALLLWTKSLVELQIVEVFYGTFMATEVAYYTYIYAKVDKEYYQQVTSHTRASILAGRALSGILAQLLISFKGMDYRQLNYITFAAMVAATLWSFLLPSVEKSIYFHRVDSNQNQNIENESQEPPADLSCAKKCVEAFRLMKKHFVESFTNKYLIKWSIWWALSTAGFLQVQTYMQPLWTFIRNDPSRPIYNGAVEAVLTVLGFMSALLAGVLKTNWELKGDLMISFGSLLCGFIILFCASTKNVIIAYVCYVLFGALYHFMITVASAEIAKKIKDDSFGLIFGFNTFIAMILQTILTMTVVTGTFNIYLSVKNQYFVYGIYFICISIVYIVIGVVRWLRTKKDYSKAENV